MSNETTSSKNVGSTNNSQSVPHARGTPHRSQERTDCNQRRKIPYDQRRISQPHVSQIRFLPASDCGKYEIAALKEGIRVHGLLEPITIFEGKILDGRNRHRAICELVKEDSAFDFEANLKIADLPQGIAPEQYVITKTSTDAI